MMVSLFLLEQLSTVAELPFKQQILTWFLRAEFIQSSECIAEQIWKQSSFSIMYHKIIEKVYNPPPPSLSLSLSLSSVLFLFSFISHEHFFYCGTIIIYQMVNILCQVTQPFKSNVVQHTKIYCNFQLFLCNLSSAIHFFILQV